MTQVITSEEALMARLFQYIESPENNSGISKASALRIANDLAITIGVHPMALGLESETRGQVHVPEGVAIHYVEITNIIAWKRDRDADDVKQYMLDRRYRHGRSEIAPAVLSLKVHSKRRDDVRVVIVVEQRCMKKQLTDESGTGIEKALIVLVSGYPAGSVSEFLNLLGQDEALAHVPFLYFSDHDFDGFKIFSVLKYGSSNGAHLSKTRVCSKLRWVGPQKEDLFTSIGSFRSSWVKTYKQRFKRASDQEVKQAAERWIKGKRRQLRSRLVPATQKDRTLFKGFEKAGWLQYEPLVAAELQDMLVNSSKFRLADLMRVDHSCLRLAIEQRVSEVIAEQQELYPTERMTVADAIAMAQPPLPRVRSPVGQRFDELHTQDTAPSGEKTPSEISESAMQEMMNPLTL